MKNFLFIAITSILLISCVGNDKYVLKDSIGSLNKVMVVAKVSDWTGDIGQEIRTSFGELMIGLPQPEPILTLSQVAPSGFSAMMKAHRNLLIISESDNEGFSVKKNVFAQPQTIVYVQGKNDETIITLLQKHKNEIKDKLAEKQFKTIKKLGISLTIPTTFKLVDDTGEFLWLRQHLLSGIAKTGSNNILVYSIPLKNEEKVADNIVAVRDSIGKKYIPGSFEGMYMITEEAYTPFTIDASIDGKKAYETRGKWEVKDDFMAGPFLNYSVIDKKNNRVVVFEGFTYAPSVNKRAFVFELEAIAKSIKIN
jgi:hypothetical protein